MPEAINILREAGLGIIDTTSAYTKGYDFETQKALGEAQLKAWKSDKALVDKAKKAKKEGKDLDEVITDPNEQKRLKEILGLGEDANLTSVSLETLQTASETLAHKMVDLANELAAAMAMLGAGQIDQIRYNANTGHFEGIKFDNENMVEKQMTVDEIGVENLTPEER
jgi:hypothetical protein